MSIHLKLAQQAYGGLGASLGSRKLVEIALGDLAGHLRELGVGLGYSVVSWIRAETMIIRGGGYAYTYARMAPMRTYLLCPLLLASFAVRSSSTTSVPPRPPVPPPSLRYRAVAIDIDGTLATSRRVERTWLSKGPPAHVSDATVAALKSYVQLGGRVCLATGRGRAFTTALARSLENERGLEISDLVCSDGALVLARSGPGGELPPRPTHRVHVFARAAQSCNVAHQPAMPYHAMPCIMPCRDKPLRRPLRVGHHRSQLHALGSRDRERDQCPVRTHAGRGIRGRD